ncbi:MAG: helix-turn-helix domain-containing protein [Anaerolineae bacterium]
MPTPHSALIDLLAHIEHNLHEPLTLDALAGASGLSRFQIIRLFARLCGVTPMAYVRGRRLAGSLAQLLEGDSVLDVALNWGFEYEQSYIRAFREVYGTTPARFRRQQRPLPITDVPLLSGFAVSASGMLGQPQVTMRPMLEMTGRPKRYNYADNLLEGIPLEQGIRGHRGGLYQAMCHPGPPGGFTHEYLVAEPVGEGEPVSGYVTWRWPAGTWAAFRYIGLHALDAEGARRFRLLASLVVGLWFQERGRRWDGRFVEHVDSSCLAEDYCEVELDCPLGVG